MKPEIFIFSVSDRKIAELVMILNKRGLETFKSCQGHNGDDWRWNFPWVAFLGDSQVKRIRRIIKEYNKNCAFDEEKWEVKFTEKLFEEKPVYWLRPIHHYKKLEFLQAQIKNLANYLDSC